ncbi:alanine--glyoxylate aminotransferase family protein [candidate division WOR-3 bacterium]|uniref:Alanine--glyoxylate aminotransferase family protein n=1 Tax=candidate division WOR-3 bacterium TaxID=2052148 RepID=A0A938BS70_UNCW3|nr:alanine--glyoxylate aminotransferase family protein [candidate division WOR-3 bacterium]
MVRPKYKLYTPGPVDVPQEFLKELASGLVYHREASFAAIYESVRSGLQKMMLTKGEVHVLTASGTGAMEAAVSNLISPDEKVLVATAGRFGERWREINLRFGAFVDELSRPYGESIPPEELERRLLANDSARCVFTTLTETSTGVLHDVRAFGEICHRLNRILVVDAVAGLGADELRMDDWHVDVVVGGSQKGLAVPPGVSFVALSQRAAERVDRARAPRYYFDLRIARRYAAKGQTSWTPAISIIYALDLSLKRLNRTGMQKYWKAHREIGDLMRAKATALGLELFPKRASNSLTVMKMPQGVDGVKVVDICKKRDKILLANGQGDMRGKIVRIGHMGPVTKVEMAKVFGCFQRALKQVRGRAKK